MAGYSKIINFIKDLYGNQEFTPLAVPKFIGNEKKYLEECIDTTFVSSVCPPPSGRGRSRPAG